MNNLKTIAVDLSDNKTYLRATLFIGGNILLPQLLHLIGGGYSLVFIPILFFTLYAAVRYGFTVTLLTAILSPLFSNLLTGMPTDGMLGVLMIKGAVMALTALILTTKGENISLVGIVTIAVIAQIVGSLFQLALSASLTEVTETLYTSLPGIAAQILLVWLLTSKLCIRSKR